MPYDGDIKDFTVTDIPAPDIDPEIKKVLQEARNLIAKGWTQGHLRVGNKFCMIGAIERASLPLSHKAVRCLGKVICPNENSDSAGVYVVVFNDTPGRTKKEVLAMFDRAINE